MSTESRPLDRGRDSGASGPRPLWIQVLPSKEAAAQRAAEIVARRLRASVERKGLFAVALSCCIGADTMIDALTTMSLPWSSVNIFQLSDWLGSPGQHALARAENALRQTGATILPIRTVEAAITNTTCVSGRSLGTHLDLLHLGFHFDGYPMPLFADESAHPGQDLATTPVVERVQMTRIDERRISTDETLWLVIGESSASSLLEFGEHGSLDAVTGKGRVRMIADASAAQVVASRAPRWVYLWHREEADSE